LVERGGSGDFFNCPSGGGTHDEGCPESAAEVLGQYPEIVMELVLPAKVSNRDLSGSSGKRNSLYLAVGHWTVVDEDGV
jgi:hypothetical protein